MDKNWLIRTHQHQILGPVAKEKIIEFVKNGALHQNDEICSGNGYWFSLKETALIQRYLYGNEVQCFNPISEAKDVISKQGAQKAAASPAQPDPHASEDITVVGLNVKDMMAKAPAAKPKAAAPVPAPQPKPKPAAQAPSKAVQGGSTVMPKPKPPVPHEAPEAQAKKPEAPEVEEVHFPKSDDLDFPDLASASKTQKIHEAHEEVHVSTVKDVHVAPPKAQAPAAAPVADDVPEASDSYVGLAPADADLEYPELPEKPKEVKAPVDPVVAEKAKLAKEAILKAKGGAPPAEGKGDKKSKKNKKAKDAEDGLDVERVKGNDRWLWILLVLLLLGFCAAGFFYYFKILNKPLPFGTNILIEKAYAQTSTPEGDKKKSRTNFAL